MYSKVRWGRERHKARGEGKLEKGRCKRKTEGKKGRGRFSVFFLCII
jgi:hypothetical protein